MSGKRCTPIVYNKEIVQDADLAVKMAKLSGQAGEMRLLETCDLTAQYGMDNVEAQSIFVGDARTISDKLKELDSRKAPPIEEDKAEEQIEKMKTLVSFYAKSAPLAKAIQWGSETDDQAGSLAKDMQKKISDIDSGYSAIVEALSAIIKNAQTQTESTDNTKELIDEYEEWVDAQKKIVNDKLKNNNSFEARSAAMEIEFEMRSSLSQIGFGGRSNLSDNAFSGRSAANDQSFELRAGLNDLSFELTRTKNDRSFELNSILGALSSVLWGKITDVQGDNFSLALVDAKRIINGDLSPAYFAGYTTVVKVMESEMPEVIERLAANMPSILSNMDVVRSKMFAKWSSDTDKALTERRNAGVKFDEAMRQGISSQAKKDGTEKSLGEDALRREIEAYKAKISGMIDAL